MLIDEPIIILLILSWIRQSIYTSLLHSPQSLREFISCLSSLSCMSVSNLYLEKHILVHVFLYTLPTETHNNTSISWTKSFLRILLKNKLDRLYRIAQKQCKPNWCMEIVSVIPGPLGSKVQGCSPHILCQSLEFCKVRYC